MAPSDRGWLERAARWPGSRWRILGILGAVIGAASLALIGLETGEEGWNVASGILAGLLGGGVGGGIPLALYLLLTQRVRSEARDREARALANIRPLAGPLPLDLGGWAADPVLADEVLRAVVRREPDLVVECGSGWTTVLVARCLHELGTGRIVAFEHDRRYADRTTRLLDRYSGSERVNVVHAPITEREVGGESHRWYGEKADGSVSERIDLLLVDGPPGGLAPKIRYPAVPLLADRLTSDALIFLDDARRGDESDIAEAWEGQLGVEPRFVESRKGALVFERDGGAPSGDSESAPA